MSQIIITPDLQFFMETNGAARSTQQLLFKNIEQAVIFTVNPMALTLITDIDYPGKHTYSVTSITRSSTTATVTTSATNSLVTGQSVTIAGATQTQYNGTFTITVTGGTTFTYTVSGSPATPATGTITAYGGKTTVPGIVYLDGYFFVMDEDARIYNSALGDGGSWGALDFITAEKEPGGGVAIAKSQNYIIAFKEWSTEYFYDAANPTGSPLSPVDNGFTLVGCANGYSVTNLDGTLFWMSQTKQKGRSIHMMSSLQTAQISTPDVERILNADDLATVYSYGLKIGGHAFYILTLVTSNITLAYDIISKTWSQWSSYTLNGSSKSVSSIAIDGTTATVTTSTAHGLSDGDPVKIAGANEAELNGIFQTRYVDSTSFKFECTPATDSVSSITRSSTTATVTTSGNHGLTNGQKVTISGANQSDYNGTYTIAVTGVATFTYTVANSPVTPATGTIIVTSPGATASGTITATGYTESYFKYTKYAHCNGRDLVLHESDGHLYEIDDETYQDAGIPINVLIRTGKLDGGSTNNKTMGKIEVVGNKVASNAMIRWSDDDYATNSAYRIVDLDATRSQIRRCGDFRRRSFDVRHIDNTSLQLAELELEGV